MGKTPRRKYNDLAAARRRFCPFCEELLNDVTVDDSVPVQQCPACDSLWLNRNDLSRIRRRAGVLGHDEDRLRSIPAPGPILVCPRCDVRELRRIITPAGFMHRCRECGGIMTSDVDRGLTPLLVSAHPETSREETIVAWVLIGLLYVVVFVVMYLWNVYVGS